MKPVSIQPAPYQTVNIKFPLIPRVTGTLFQPALWWGCLGTVQGWTSYGFMGQEKPEDLSR